MPTNIITARGGSKRIPGMLPEVREDYRFYLRSNGRQYGPVDMVLFAV